MGVLVGQLIFKDEKRLPFNETMPFNVQLRQTVEWGDLMLYPECDTVIDVLMYLLADWVAGDVVLDGTFEFLAEHGRDFGIKDSDVDEGTDPDLLEAASEAVLELCCDNETLTNEYLIAIGDFVRIFPLPDEE